MSEDSTAGATITVIEQDRAGIVTYRGDDGQRFRLLFRPKPNPIGFTAKLNVRRT